MARQRVPISEATMQNLADLGLFESTRILVSEAAALQVSTDPDDLIWRIDWRTDRAISRLGVVIEEKP